MTEKYTAEYVTCKIIECIKENNIYEYPGLFNILFPKFRLSYSCDEDTPSAVALLCILFEAMYNIEVLGQNPSYAQVDVPLLRLSEQLKKDLEHTKPELELYTSGDWHDTIEDEYILFKMRPIEPKQEQLKAKPEHKKVEPELSEEIKKYIREEIERVLSNNMYFKLGDLRQVSLNVKNNDDGCVTQKEIFRVKTEKRHIVNLDLDNYFDEDPEPDALDDDTDASPEPIVSTDGEGSYHYNPSSCEVL